MPTEVKQVTIKRVPFEQLYQVECEHCNLIFSPENYLGAQATRRQHLKTNEHKANASKATP